MPLIAAVLIAGFATARQWSVLPPEATKLPIYNQMHLKTFGPHAPRLNQLVLEAVDKVQATQPDGGGYFIGITATPAESPVGYPLALLNTKLLEPPRTTSYCSGSSYAVFIEAMNLAFKNHAPTLSQIQLEAMRMQEPDGGRREDKVKFWGWWNANGPGSNYALVQYAGIGQRVKPSEALPGDFLNINWKSGLGHSVVFLGWALNDLGQKCVMYWSSQKRTNGFADDLAPITTVSDVVFTRLTHPELIENFDPNTPVDTKVNGDAIDWP